ncbi:MAG TPA: alkaline phosphatase family protein [Woeseiaceae bacterium]|nr:alkaline phosphatase family protein [Woeseiaceae bacterium]
MKSNSAGRRFAFLSLLALIALPIPARAAKIPRPDHVVIVIEENKSFDQIIAPSVMAKSAAPYINALAAQGALFTDSYALGHPSQPNYLALFSGSTHGVRDNRCPLALSGPNLANVLLERGLSFATYSESMPARGFEGCFSEDYLYARKHNPAVNWGSLPSSVNLRFADFPQDYSKLPTIALLIPSQVDDMHSGRSPKEAIGRGDAWLKARIDPYIRWAASHNSLFILTWDEDDFSSGNHIATLFVGPMVRPGRYGARIDHYSVLRTLTDMYDLPALGNAAGSDPITQVWKVGR